MSFEERGTWVFAVVTVVSYAAYLVIVLGRAGDAPLEDVDYVATMLWTIGIAIAASIVGHILVAIANPDDADKADVRDREVNRFGEYWGGLVLGAAMIGPFVLTITEAEHFWIANAMYAAFVIGGLVGAIVKIVAYRRGIS